MTKQYSTPGPRAIYPEMCDSPSLGRVGLLANALFPRLIAQADDQGRLPGGAREVLMLCMPHLPYVSVNEVDAALAELEAEGHVQRYAAASRNLLQILTWWRWQNNMRRAYPSRWPAPKGWTDLVYGAWGDGLKTLDEAMAATPRRNAATRGSLPQYAARATGADAGARVGARARGVPDRALPDRSSREPAPEAPAPSGAGPRGGPPSRFSELVPPPPGHATKGATT